MDEHDGGLGLVAVLAAWSRSAGVKFLDVPQEVDGRERGGVHASGLAGFTVAAVSTSPLR